MIFRYFLLLLFSRSVVSDSLWPHGLQHARLPCPSPCPRASSNSCASSRWCHPIPRLILCRPLLLLPSIFSRIRVFSNELALSIRWPKYWSFSFSISPPNEYLGLIFFRMDWFHNFNDDNITSVIHCYITNEKFKTNVIYYLTSPVWGTCCEKPCGSGTCKWFKWAVLDQALSWGF